MKKFIITICIILFVIINIWQFIIVPKLIDYIEQQTNNELTSEEMKDEIIRQLKEKEGKTIEDYYIEEYFRRRTK